MKKNVEKMQLGTQAVHAGVTPDPSTGAITTPIIQSSTYVQKEIGQRYDYARTSHPTREALEESLRTLEGTTYAYVFASGMAAADTICKILRPGDEIIASTDLYGGVYRLFEQMYRPMGIAIHYVSMQDMQELEACCSSATRLLWLESPSNPMLEVINIAKVAEIGRKYGALTVVDNTFATPYLQKPMALGADIVLHSLTKYINGHADVLMGALCCSEEQISEHFTTAQRNVGAVPAPVDCFLVMRGIKTLHLRMRAHCEHAAAVAHFLQRHPAVEKVHFPGLKEHPNHSIAAQQMKGGFGGMLSFTLKKGAEKDVMTFLKHLKVFSLAESLGSVESLACYPAKMTHASVPEEQRLKRGITDNLIRLSIGIEAAPDLIEDLKQALDYLLKK